MEKSSIEILPVVFISFFLVAFEKIELAWIFLFEFFDLTGFKIITYSILDFASSSKVFNLAFLFVELIFRVDEYTTTFDIIKRDLRLPAPESPVVISWIHAYTLFSN